MINAALVDRGVGVALSGSLYAVAPAERQAAAQALAEHDLWVHADVFAGGVSLESIAELPGAVDVHLVTVEALGALDDVSGVARVTFPFEGTDVPAVAAGVRATGASPWLAIAPQTTFEACADALPHVDGLLVMLLEPGSSGRSDPTLLTKVQRASQSMPVGVDGGVGEDNLGAILAAGATYVVIGRRLFPVDPENPS